MTATILIVEDSDLGEQLVEILEMEGYNPILAREGMKGLQLAGDHQPDVILTDFMLPQLDGLEFIRRIRAVPALAGIPIIVMSAAADYKDQALAAGAALFLSKPFRNAEFLASIRQVLSEQ